MYATALSACAIAPLLAAGFAGCGPSADQQRSIPASVAAPTGLATPGRLTVAVPAALPPYGFRGTQGDAEGLAVDLGDAMAFRMGLGLHVVSVDSDALSTVAQPGSVDVVIGTTPLTRDTTPPHGFVLVPYVRAASELVVTQDSAFQPQQPTELCGRSVAVVSGTREEALLSALASQCGHAPPDMHSALSNDEAVRALDSGGADAYLADSATAAFDRARYGGLMTTSGELAGTQLAIALRADSPTIEDSLTRAFYTVRADGEYETLVKKWGMTEQSL